MLQAIAAARRANMRLVLAAAENDYFREVVAPLVDGDRVVFEGEVDLAGKVALLGGARALLYPLQAEEPFWPRLGRGDDVWNAGGRARLRGRARDRR